MKKTLNIGGRLLDLSEPKVMGILNITPDSFYGNSRVAQQTDALLKAAEKMRQEGATFLDVGGYSTRPGAADVSVEEEMKRVLPAIEAIRSTWPEQLISVDTFRSEVAKAAVAAGANLINDVSGGTLDSQMFSVVANLGVPYVLMHMRGNPQTMASQAHYTNIALDVMSELQQQLAHLHQKGVKDIILDPGFGFAKNIEQNYELMAQLNYLHLLETPLLVGISRKSMLWKALGITPEEALPATSALHMVALQKGASILRVHDVKEGTQTIQLYAMLKPFLPAVK